MPTSPTLSERASVVGGTLVIVPSYNEIDNLRSIVGRVLAAVPTAHVLVIDDGSPDGTGAEADDMARLDDRIFAIHRVGKLGLGSAYLRGFRWSLDRDYGLIVEMDADGSHPPESLPEMIRVATEPDATGSVADLVIGSRWTPGGTVVNWPIHRELLSRGGNSYARLVLGISVRDATGGFRVFRSEALRAVPLDEVNAKGYFFQVDMTVRVLDLGFRIVEVPIEFREREAGTSKMSQSIIVEAMIKVTLWGAKRRLAQLGRFLGVVKAR